MKTIIKIFISLFISLLCSVNIVAQINYYATTKTFNQSGYTYQCDVVQGDQGVTLYNKSNKLTYTDQCYKSTGKMPSIEEFAQIDDVLDDSWTRAKSKKIVNDSFSSEERERVKGSVLGISMFIDPDTGKVIEVRFELTTFSPFATIPVSVYREIETELKNNIWFTPTPDGKKLNYIYCGWYQKITTP